MAYDAIVIGGGAAGLACAAELGKAGMRTLLLEAAGRLGGRILTVNAASLNAPIELGAEFVHGRPPQIFSRIEAAGGTIVPIEGDDWCVMPAGLSRCEFFEQVEDLLERMKSVRSRDISFSEFLASLPLDQASEQVRHRALSYVVGFNAARAEQISVQSLLDDQRAADEIGGDQSYRIVGGYGVLVDALESECKAAGVELRLKHRATHLDYSGATLAVSGISEGRNFTEAADKVVVTIPTPLLQQNAICFKPDLPNDFRSALTGVANGQVVRLVVLFKERFWADLKTREGKSLDAMRFLFTQQPPFPTWWTARPTEAAMLVAWAPAHHAEALFNADRELLVARALDQLAGNLRFDRAYLQSLLDSAHVHPWHADPLACGAYSYYKAGWSQAAQTLSKPIAGKLFFAGEATETHGHHSTVHGALASGERAAAQILKSAH